MSISYAPKGYAPAPTLLQNKTILVTGAGDGIGRAAAIAYAARGATVILVGRTVSKLEQVYDQIESSGGPQPAILELDMASATEDNFLALADSVAEAFPHLDGLLHNAAVLGEMRPIQSTVYDRWSEIMQVNVNAQFLLTQATLPLMQRAPSSSIIFTSSSVGRTGRAYWGAYAVSKFATEGLMQTLAAELENTSKIRVNSLNPGATNTAMRRAAYPAEEPSNNPLPEHIMGVYLYLMGDDSAEHNGAAFNAQ